MLSPHLAAMIIFSLPGSVIAPIAATLLVIGAHASLLCVIASERSDLTPGSIGAFIDERRSLDRLLAWFALAGAAGAVSVMATLATVQLGGLGAEAIGPAALSLALLHPPDVSGWPDWMVPGGLPRHMPLDLPDQRLKVVRTDGAGRSNKDGGYFTVRPA